MTSGDSTALASLIGILPLLGLWVYCLADFSRQLLLVFGLLSMIVAAVFLGERLTAPKLLGAAAILLGVAVTRLPARPSPESDPPPEE